MSMRSWQDQCALEDADYEAFRASLGDAGAAYDRHTLAEQMSVPCAAHGKAIGEPCLYHGKTDEVGIGGPPPDPKHPGLPMYSNCTERRVAAARADTA